jgi:excinuclease ABC subunit A
MTSQFIKIRGARQHNLKNVSLDIPRDRLVVITGLSGSGKSSLAFDTIYAEGQRRYVESLSAYARQFLEKMDKPEVDSIEGLSPAIAIQQRGSARNPRSTVATVTEIHDHLRVLFARVGEPHCPRCAIPIRSQTIQQMVDQIMALEEGTRIQILAPLVEGRKGEHTQLLGKLRKDGFTRVRINGRAVGLDEPLVLDKRKRHDIGVIVDRLIMRSDIRRRLTDTLELTLAVSGGRAVVEVMGEGDRSFNQKAACPRCGFSFQGLSPQLFSFNSPQGACPECEGLGTKRYIDPRLIVPDPSLSLSEGAIVAWGRNPTGYFQQMVESVCRHYGVDAATPFSQMPEKARGAVLLGTKEEEVPFRFEREGRRYEYVRAFEGVIPWLERRYRETSSYAVREEIEAFMNLRPCPACAGSRLRPEARAVRVGGKGIHEVGAMSVALALRFFETLSLGPRESAIAERVLKEIRARLGFLHNVGLDYLTLDRSSMTLSGGEDQRIRLATQIGSGLAGVLYVLDEPSIGLHQRDNLRLLQNLRNLTNLGNTVLVVEHDAETIRAADHVIDMGPGAGIHGGEVVFEGSPDALAGDGAASLTGHFLSGRRAIALPQARRTGVGKWISIRGARENNLKGIHVTIPLGTLTCITGVSGSGKSSLVNGVLYPALCQRLFGSKLPVGQVETIEGTEWIDKVIRIDQSPIGRTPRSNPATYTGLFMPIRELFSRVPESRVRGYRPGRFSFNVKGGRCEVCRGDGVIRIEMQFLPDVYVTCEACGGLRYNRDTLEIRYKGYHIAEVLAMPVEQAHEFLGNIPAARDKLRTLLEVGLGYLRLGQSATTLSGGEAQRVKLSRELSRKSTGRTLYLLDEPTTGLHFADIERLLQVLDALVALKNTVVVIEHNLDVIKTADHVIDLGPEGGDLGGYVVGAGTPEQIAALPKSHTGRFLKRVLGA